jgi:hypothetical protein
MELNFHNIFILAKVNIVLNYNRFHIFHKSSFAGHCGHNLLVLITLNFL